MAHATQPQWLAFERADTTSRQKAVLDIRVDQIGAFEARDDRTLLIYRVGVPLPIPVVCTLNEIHKLLRKANER